MKGECLRQPKPVPKVDWNCLHVPSVRDSERLGTGVMADEVRPKRRDRGGVLGRPVDRPRTTSLHSPRTRTFKYHTDGTRPCMQQHAAWLSATSPTSHTHPTHARTHARAASPRATERTSQRRSVSHPRPGRPAFIHAHAHAYTDPCTRADPRTRTHPTRPACWLVDVQHTTPHHHIA